MAKYLDANLLTIGLVMVTAGLLGQYAAQGISPVQWLAGIAAVSGSIALAVIVRTWPKSAAAKVEA